jgi:hypothetical protein
MKVKDLLLRVGTESLIKFYRLIQFFLITIMFIYEVS